MDFKEFKEKRVVKGRFTSLRSEIFCNIIFITNIQYRQ